MTKKQTCRSCLFYEGHLCQCPTPFWVNPEDCYIAFEDDDQRQPFEKDYKLKRKKNAPKIECSCWKKNI